MTIDGRFLAPVPGVSIGACAAGIKDNNSLDMALFVLDPESEATAVFIRNTAAAAPVIIARRHLLSGSIRALLVNSGCANAGTGAAGLEVASRSCQDVADFPGIEKHQVLPFSTGMIGMQLAGERLADALPLCLERACEDNWWAAAEAIMTTDTVAKGFSVFNLSSAATSSLLPASPRAPACFTPPWRPCWPTSPPMPGFPTPISK